MTRIEVLNKIDSIINLVNLVKIGVINWTHIRDRDIYLRYDIYKRMGKSEMDAKEQTAIDFKVCFKTVQRAVKKMRQNEDFCNYTS